MATETAGAAAREAAAEAAEAAARRSAGSSSDASLRAQESALIPLLPRADEDGCTNEDEYEACTNCILLNAQLVCIPNMLHSSCVAFMFIHSYSSALRMNIMHDLDARRGAPR